MSYVAAIAGCLFVTLSLASGLLWLSELIEEHTKMAKLIGTRAIYTIIVIHSALWFFDALPLSLTAFSIFCHWVYLQNFAHTWPFISLISPSFLGSCVLVIIDHFVWFHHFAQKTQEARVRGPARGRMAYQQQTVEAPVFMDIAAFFAICVWFVPLFLFLSLSANDNALPTSSGLPPQTPVAGDIGSPKKEFTFSLPRKSLLASIVDPIFAALPRLRRGNRRNPEGIIAPRTPNRSPLHTPIMPTSSLPPWTPSGNGHNDFDLLTPPLNGQAYTRFEGGLRKMPSIPLRNPPKRTNTAPPRPRASLEGASDSEATYAGLGIRPSSRASRRMVHGEDDLIVPRTDSPLMR